MNLIFLDCLSFKPSKTDNDHGKHSSKFKSKQPSLKAVEDPDCSTIAHTIIISMVNNDDDHWTRPVRVIFRWPNHTVLVRRIGQWVINQWVPTGWAGWIWHEPCVYASHMIPMVTLGQCPYLLSINKFSKAYGAFSAPKQYSSQLIHHHRNPAKIAPLQASWRKLVHGFMRSVQGIPLLLATPSTLHNGVKPKCNNKST